jgi:hypothetical protein
MSRSTMARPANLRRRLAPLAGAGLLLASCLPAAAPTPTIKSEPPRVAVRVTPAPELEGAVIAAALQASGLPIADVRVFTADTDPDKTLGRPNQYNHKVSWRDTRGGADATVELFPTLASLEARKRLIESRNSRDGNFVEYIYERTGRRALMRLPRTLSLEQAREYEEWFDRL